MTWASLEELDYSSLRLFTGKIISSNPYFQKKQLQGLSQLGMQAHG